MTKFRFFDIQRVMEHEEPGWFILMLIVIMPILALVVIVLGWLPLLIIIPIIGILIFAQSGFFFVMKDEEE